MADTRKDKRAPVSLKVRFKSATVDEFIEHYSKDVSRGGIYIKSSLPMQVGTLLKFQFQLKDDTALIRGVGRVVWTRVEEDATADNPAGMGIKFIKMDNDSRAMVERIVDAQEPEQGTYESGRYNASSAEPSSAPPPSEGGKFFPDLPPAVLPPPEDRTAVRQATQFLAAALTEGSTDTVATREAQEKAEQARQRQQEVEAERKAEQKKQAEHKSNGEQKKAQADAQREADQRAQAAQRQAETKRQAEAKRQADAQVAQPKQVERAAVTREQAAQRALDELTDGAAAGLPSMIIDPSLEPRAGRPSEEARESDATPLPRPHPALTAEAADEPDTEPPPAPLNAPGAPTTSIPHSGEAPRKSYLPYAVIAALVLVAAIVALREAPEERAVDPAGEAQQEESLREVADQPTPVTPEAPVAPAPVAPSPEPVVPAPAPADVHAAVSAATPQPGPELIKVDVTTTPKRAEIWVGDENRGKSPVTLELPAGVLVVVRAKAEGHGEARSELTPSKRATLKLKLKETPWIVHVETTPPGAAVNVGGHKGVAPVDLTLDDPPKGELSVNAKLEGYQSTRTRLAPGSFSQSDDAMRAQLSLTLKASLPTTDTNKDAAPLADPKPPAVERVKKAPAAKKAEPKPSVEAAPVPPEAVEPAETPAEIKAPPAEARPAPEAKPAPEAPATKPPEKLPDNPFGE
ncbi:MAG: hypothetical protein RLZZ450_2298 [Pseudomonadota bacterium]|jgi:uncharacterized protein (TIGR02266 family)